MKFQTYRLEGTSALEHLAYESCLMETWTTGDALLCFYVNEPCLVIGRNQNPWREARPGSGLPLYRRSSGGGTVYHDLGNLNWAMILPRESHDKDGELKLLSGALRESGFPVSPGERGGLYFSPGSALAGRKVSGTARRFGPRTVLHHGTLLVSSDLKALEYSLGGIATEDDKSLPSVPALPANLGDCPEAGTGGRTPSQASRKGVGPWDIASAISRAVAGEDIKPLPPEYLPPEAVAREKEILGSQEWIFGNTPSFRFSLHVGGWGEGKASFQVEKGILQRADAQRDDRFAPYEGAVFSISLYKKLLETAETKTRRKED